MFRSLNLLVVLALAGADVLAQDELPISARIPALADELIPREMQEHDVPGTVVVVVSRDGDIHRAGYGLADLMLRTPMDPDRTLVRVASVSKVLSALAALELVGEGLLDLQAPLGSAELVRNQFDEPVTLHTLLTHTSGLDRRSVGMRARHPDSVQDLGEHLEHFLNPVVRHPGSSFAYSNYGFALAGLQVERAAGTPFAEHMATRIFQPLGMVDSRFDLLESSDPRLATGYSGSDRVEFQPAHTAPAGMMSTTAADMARFMVAVLNDGRVAGAETLAPETLRQMMGSQFRNAPGLKISYGYGLFVVDRLPGRADSVYHTGDMQGWSARLEIFPDDGLGIFLASNSADGANVHYLFSRALIDAYSTVPAPAEPTPVKSEALTDHTHYAGEFIYDGVPVTTFDRFPTLLQGGRLVKPGPGGRLMIGGDPYIEVAPGAFRREGGWGIDAVFPLDERGRPESLRTSNRTYHLAPGFLSVRQQRTLLLGSALFLAISALAWTVRGAMGTLRHRPRRRHSPLIALAACVGLAYLAFFVVLAATGGTSLESGVPPLILGALTFATMAAGLALSLPIAAVFVARSGMSTTGKVHYMTFVGAALLAAAILYHWNVVGFHL